ncbi:MAG: hypothetical protein LBN00_08465 [Oscillospiraceae bacterium]|nr:hypothetical protein [Oscillospiraceae bacterium]
MNKSNRRKVNSRRALSFVYHALFLLIVFVVQALILPYIKTLPSIPLILPLAAVGAAMFEGGARGAAVGLFAGVLCDVSMNRPVAQFTVLFTVICLIIGVLSDTVFARGFAPYFILCVITLTVCSAAQMFTLLFFDGAEPRWLLAEATWQLLVSLPFTVPIYFGARGLVRRSENNE